MSDCCGNHDCCKRGKADTAGDPVWYCPMCDGVGGDKPGDCPKCGMPLERNPAARASRGTTFTCPMHPEVVSDRAGACPKCGMDLEPVAPAAGDDAGRDPGYDRMAVRFWVGLALSVPLLVLAMGGMIPMLAPLVDAIPPGWNRWIQFLLASPVVCWGGWTFFQRGWRSVVTWNLNMFTLIALGTGAAYVFSVAALVVPGVFPDSFRHHGQVAIYFESAAVIVTLVLLGQMLEARAREKTGDAIKALLDQAPKVAVRLTDEGIDEEVSVDAVRVGDRLRVKPGGRVPVDGVIVEGSSRIDESMVTGEPVPVAKTGGDEVTGGTINDKGAFVMVANRVGADTVLSRIVDMVAQAQRSRAPIQGVADRVASYFVPAVVAVAAIAFIVWGLAGPEPRLAYALVNAVAVLIVACPCALGLATPMSIMVGVGRGAAEGVLIRDAEALERLEKVDTVVVDKTGTLTAGKPKVVAMMPADGVDERELVRIAASVEASSEHPLASAIMAKADDDRIDMPAAREFISVTGEGVNAVVDGERAFVGTRVLIEGEGMADVSLLEKSAAAERGKGRTVVFVARGGRPLGWIAVADPIKAGTPDAVRRLHALGLRIVMVTGDNEETARTVARELGIDEFHARVKPEAKKEWIEKLRRGGSRVAMAGDGINDAPALAAADVGLAMGTGTDVAIESAGITLAGGDLRGIDKAVRLSRRTMRNIRQNLFFAFIYNSLGVPVAAGVLYPFFGLLLSPMIASAAMSFSSVSVIANALRLRTQRI